MIDLLLCKLIQQANNMSSDYWLDHGKKKKMDQVSHLKKKKKKKLTNCHNSILFSTKQCIRPKATFDRVVFDQM